MSCFFEGSSEDRGEGFVRAGVFGLFTDSLCDDTMEIMINKRLLHAFRGVTLV